VVLIIRSACLFNSVFAGYEPDLGRVVFHQLHMTLAHCDFDHLGAIGERVADLLTGGTGGVLSA
jgi:hypothetical protein